VSRAEAHTHTVQWAIKERNLLNYNSPSHIRRGRNKKQACRNKRTKHNNKAALSISLVFCALLINMCRFFIKKFIRLVLSEILMAPAARKTFTTGSHCAWRDCSLNLAIDALPRATKLPFWLSETIS
jgi:hypothetical protein